MGDLYSVKFKKECLWSCDTSKHHKAEKRNVQNCRSVIPMSFNPSYKLPLCGRRFFGGGKSTDTGMHVPSMAGAKSAVEEEW